MKNIIKLKREFYGPVRNKIKVATTRKSDKGLHEGDRAVLIFTDDGSLDGKLKMDCTIESVEKLNFSEITKEMAQSEGYSTVAAFKSSLKRFYSDLKEDSDIYYIRFKIQVEQESCKLQSLQ